LCRSWRACGTILAVGKNGVDDSGEMDQNANGQPLGYRRSRSTLPRDADGGP
jgi:hypothetical protein